MSETVWTLGELECRVRPIDGGRAWAWSILGPGAMCLAIGTVAGGEAQAHRCAEAVARVLSGGVP